MANFFPKKLLELDSFLKVRDPFIFLKFSSFFFWPRSFCQMGQIICWFCFVLRCGAPVFLALQMKYFFVHSERLMLFLGVDVSLSGTNPKHPWLNSDPLRHESPSPWPHSSHQQPRWTGWCKYPILIFVFWRFSALCSLLSLTMCRGDSGSGIGIWEEGFLQTWWLQYAPFRPWFSFIVWGEYCSGYSVLELSFT